MLLAQIIYTICSFVKLMGWCSIVIANILDYNVIVFLGLLLVVAIQQYCSLYLVEGGPGYTSCQH